MPARGALYTGLKPAGTPVGPVIPMAEEAVATGSPERVTAYLASILQDKLSTRLQAVGALAADKGESVADGRRYVETMLGFEVYCHRVFQTLHSHDRHGGRRVP